MRLQLTIDGAPPAALQRGLQAAAAVFDRARIHPFAAAEAAWLLEGWDDRGFPEPAPDDRTFDLAQVWNEAREAAWRACCPEAGEEVPLGAGLELLLHDDDQANADAAVLGLVAIP